MAYFLRTRDDRSRSVPVHRSAVALAFHALRRRASASVSTYLGFRGLKGFPALIIYLFTRPSVLLFIAAVALSTLLFAMLLADGPVALGMVLTTPIAFPLILACMVGVRGLLSFHTRLAAASEAAALRRAKCPGCSYSLAGLDPAPDSLVVCPECSAAWHHARLGPAGRSGAEVIVIPTPPTPPPHA